MDGTEENAFDVRVDEIEFLGSFVRADLLSEKIGDHRLRADLSINLVRRLDINEGDTVSVSVPMERIRVYPRQ